jgi:hypothetical protein
MRDVSPASVLRKESGCLKGVATGAEFISSVLAINPARYRVACAALREVNCGITVSGR